METFQKALQNIPETVVGTGSTTITSGILSYVFFERRPRIPFTATNFMIDDRALLPVVVGGASLTLNALQHQILPYFTDDMDSNMALYVARPLIVGTSASLAYYCLHSPLHNRGLIAPFIIAALAEIAGTVAIKMTTEIKNIRASPILRA